ncbi:MAG: cobyrinate a,c-diamide synthase [Bacillota bacterium]|jgi:cobyrinic acid a,c-diamide synthase
MLRAPRLVVAGTHSGVGKTTVATGLMAALSRRGHAVQGFKVGPDYIDPAFHASASGSPSRNLDPWLTGEDGVLGIFTSRAKEISVIEGVMGLFDGGPRPEGGSALAPGGGWGSTAHVAMMLKAPVLLVLDAAALARSAAAMVKGYLTFEPGLHVSGCIVNKVSGPGHIRSLKRHIEGEAGVPVVGAIPASAGLRLPERHLGLVPARETEALAEVIHHMGQVIEEHVDLEALWDLASAAPPLPRPALPQPSRFPGVRVGVAMDQAFHFYYQDALDLLESMGAEIRLFSPLEDRSLPAVDGIIIGGGFPEVFLEPLSANKGLMEEIVSRVKEGMPLYAECGGLMYLCREVDDLDGRSYPMAGLVPARAVMTQGLAGFGYVTALLARDSILGGAGDKVRGHEFHYSRLVPLGDLGVQPYLVSWGVDEEGWPEGYQFRNALCSYVHIHLLGNPRAAQRFLGACMRFRMGEA